MAKNSKSLIDPTRLEPVRKKDGLLQVIVETPKGSRNKFSFDVEQEIFSLKKVLPACTDLIASIRSPSAESFSKYPFAPALSERKT